MTYTPPTRSPENFRAFFVFLSIAVYFLVNKCDNTCTRSTTRRKTLNRKGTTMTVSELIERLEEYRELMGDDCEVRLMTQQNWPFENSITGLCSAAEIADDDERKWDEDEDNIEQIDEPEAVVYLCEGRQLGYGTKAAWDACY